ncbi:MAG: tRNA (adenosine(37)-N6)-threonylcarbamoyltransferase complex transferase subunit TsaD [Candidatus Brennerbacteria bacterium]|nr:tRNA (adenosine(37)-N6)-threonylcarbamoyltransferase complex transferase subunit TsaD [Candidatus Brennerbacteria bacterium]
MRILAIETSCDETGIALIEATGGVRAPRIRILKNLVSSQIAVHAPFGGVVPNLAKREHLKNLPVLYGKISANSKSEMLDPGQTRDLKSKIQKIDLVAVTVGPGLEPALWTGITFAKELWKKLKTQNPNIKLVGTNHLEGHLYSFLLAKNYQLKTKNLFPAIALIVSGGHTILLTMDSPVRWKKIGETRDDAVGEAFDKVARLLNLPYPGGPEIEKLANRGNPEAIAFPRPMLDQKNYDFSFSGLKTSVLYYARDHKPTTNDHNLKADIAASFQQAAIDVLISKTKRATKEFGARSILLSGGVAANRALRKRLLVVSRKLSVNFMAPPMKFNTDNAVMIGVAGYMSFLRKKARRFAAQGNLDL